MGKKDAMVASTASSASTSECVQVVVRCRPLNEKEVEQGHDQCVAMNPR